jgi:hypothetical protein
MGPPPTYVTISLSGLIPSNATELFGSLFGVGGTGAVVAGNSNWSVGMVLSALSLSTPFDFVLETLNFYYASASSSSQVYALGWRNPVLAV